MSVPRVSVFPEALDSFYSLILDESFAKTSIILENPNPAKPIYTPKKEDPSSLIPS